MKEWDKAQAGCLYNANNDREIYAMNLINANHQIQKNKLKLLKK